MRQASRAEGALDRLCKFIEALIAFGLGAMVLLVFGNVVLRYGFNSGITMTEEVSRWLFIWGTFLGAVVALREHGHLGVDMVVSKLPPAGKKACLVASHFLMLFIVGLLFKGGLDQTRLNWDVQAPTTGISMAVIHIPTLVFSVLATVILLFDLWKILTGRLSDDELVMVQESEESVQLRQVLADAESPSRSPA
ncbi:MAG: TRAP transporter small permease [Comamonadaceae bacterium]|nr:MAG: TRAP transporter small permease [Comamonadaceae bacterium]